MDNAIGSSIQDTYDIRPADLIAIIQGDQNYIDPPGNHWNKIITDFDNVGLKIIKSAFHNSWLDDKEGFDEKMKAAVERTKRN